MSRTIMIQRHHGSLSSSLRLLSSSSSSLLLQHHHHHHHHHHRQTKVLSSYIINSPHIEQQQQSSSLVSLQKYRNNNNNNNNNNTTNFFSSWTGARGYDLTHDTIGEYDKDLNIPKINITGYDETGFMVKHMIQKVVKNNNNKQQQQQQQQQQQNNNNNIEFDSEADSDGSVYMNGSIIVYPTGCFLWNIDSLQEQPQSKVVVPSFQGKSSHNNNTNTTSKQQQQQHIIPIESLLSIVLIRPYIEYLFIGCNDGYGSISNLNKIQNYFRYNAIPHHSIVVEQMQLYNAIGTFNLLNAEDRSVAAALIVDNNN